MTLLASPFNLAGPDSIIIFIIVLLLFGAKRLPELARGLGSAVREFSKAKDEIEHEITRPAPPASQIEPPRGTQSHTASSSYHDDNPYHQEQYSSDPAPAKTEQPDPHRQAQEPGPAAGSASTPV